MSGFDAFLWRVLHRVLLLLTLGVLGLLLGLGPSPGRVDSVFGLLIVLFVVAPIGVRLWRLPPRARAALSSLPRRRPLVFVTAVLLAITTALVAWWTLFNALSPGTFFPLALALTGVIVAGSTTLLARLTRL
ncbi:putative membrane protein [Saccharopolyspora lacisalsi]|uniref:Putative membrane protein n=1 Tax=Halosaccharopolyspora lacisalsi TaxID=1000566 RepID=A0A839DWJ7_9PSEU|nr:hypothetical protein [Halosaccharopolyspora lacisalsi]MBA8825260.1 putative membrane protein [Halosaccharopolyspora lacisalsi]